MIVPNLPDDPETATCVHGPLPEGAPGYEGDRWLQLAVPIDGDILATVEAVAAAGGVPLAHVVASMICLAATSFFDPGCPEVRDTVLDDAREWPV